MRVLNVIDVEFWAIGQLAKVIKEGNPHLQIEILAIPPKELRNQPEENIKKFEDKVKEFQPDIIHFHYWDTANTLSKLNCCRNKKLILTHHNQKNLLTHDWKLFDMLVVHTQKAKDILESAGYWNVMVIQHGIDVAKFKFNDNYDVNNRVIGYVGRIVPWKGLYDILKVAKELDTDVMIMGRIDKPDYWNKCLEFSENMDVRFQTPDEEQVKVYHEMGVYVGNSCDNIEEGTLPLLEAMACGIPVVTTPSGEAKDIIKDNVNGILVDFENYESLKNGIQVMLNKKEERNKIREEAWQTVKTMDKFRMAGNYEMLYYKVLYQKNLVSVIIPTYNRPDTINKIIEAYEAQTYQPVEIIVVDDGSDKEYKLDNYCVPVKYLKQEHRGYGLARARNLGILNASGNYIIFSDDRYQPEPFAVEAFVNNIKKIKEPSAIWGDKGAGKRDFIENFFCIRKKDIVNAGMFNTAVQTYGFQSQEIRERLRGLKYKLEYEPQAKASTIFGTHNKNKKRYEVLISKNIIWKLKR